MSGVTKKLMSASGGVAGFTAIEDVFSTYLYTGNSSTQTITNGIDLAGEGGLVWIKARNVAENHALTDSQIRLSSPTGSLASNSNTAVDLSGGVTSFNSDGFTLENNSLVNGVGNTHASWTFRKAPRFFDVVTYTGTGAARTVIHNLGTTVGSIIIKRTDTTSNWAVYHRGNTAAPETDFLSLNLTNATSDDATYWNDTAPTDSVFTVGANAAVNASGGTYVAYLYAHDPLGPSGDGSDGLIACGSYTAADYTNAPDVNLGWEPQWLLVKNVTTAGNSWLLYDTMRGLPTGGNDSILLPNSNGAEATPINYLDLTATGFKGANANSGSDTFIYIAIRRGPMRAPTSGTEVFAIDTRGGTPPSPPNFTSGFVTDAALRYTRTGGDHNLSSRLTGVGYLNTTGTGAEVTNDPNWKWDYMNGFYNGSFVSASQLGVMFRRAPEFFDVVAYTGDGTNTSNVAKHNLGVVPEMIIVKRRAGVSNWMVHHDALIPTFGYPNTGMPLESSGSFLGNVAVYAQSTATEFYPSQFSGSNVLGESNIAYLFATLAGISKVGSYTGNGTSQTINCGFTTGARFIIIKRTDSTGDWYVWDTARGIVAANDPHLSLNTTAAEVTTDDSVDPVSSGFIVNQVAATNINVSAASYIFYAVA